MIFKKLFCKALFFHVYRLYTFTQCGNLFAQMGSRGYLKRKQTIFQRDLKQAVNNGQSSTSAYVTCLLQSPRACAAPFETFYPASRSGAGRQTAGAAVAEATGFLLVRS